MTRVWVCHVTGYTRYMSCDRVYTIHDTCTQGMDDIPFNSHRRPKKTSLRLSVSGVLVVGVFVVGVLVVGVIVVGVIVVESLESGPWWCVRWWCVSWWWVIVLTRSLAATLPQPCLASNASPPCPCAAAPACIPRAALACMAVCARHTLATSRVL